MAQQSGSVSPANRPKTPAICYSNPRDKPLNPRAPHFAHSSPQSVSASAGTPAPSRSSTQSQLHSGLKRYRSQTASNTMGRGLASAGQSGPPPNAPTGPRLPNVKARTVAVISRSQSGPPLNAPTGPRHRNVQAMPTQALGRSRPTPKGLASVNVASVSAGLSTRVLNGPAPANQRQIQVVPPIKRNLGRKLLGSSAGTRPIYLIVARGLNGGLVTQLWNGTHPGEGIKQYDNSFYATHMERKQEIDRSLQSDLSNFCEELASTEHGLQMGQWTVWQTLHFGNWTHTKSEVIDRITLHRAMPRPLISMRA